MSRVVESHLELKIPQHQKRIRQRKATALLEYKESVEIRQDKAYWKDTIIKSEGNIKVTPWHHPPQRRQKTSMMIGANTKVRNAAYGLLLICFLQPAAVHSFVHGIARHNEKQLPASPHPSSFMGRPTKSKSMTSTRLQYKEDGFTTGPFGKPATSSEEDMELTRQIILDHIAGEMCQMKEINSKQQQLQQQPTAALAAEALGSKQESSTGSRSNDTTILPSHLSSDTAKKAEKRQPSSKDVRLTRQVILDHIATETTGDDPVHPTSVAKAKKSMPRDPQPSQRVALDSNTKTPSPEREAAKPSVRRAGVLGVSVSPIGFILLLSTSHQLPPNAMVGGAGAKSQSKMVVPLRISSAPNDISTTNSTEALTTIQLLWGIDMAAAGVLEPDALQTLVALYCSEDDESDLYGDPNLPPEDQCNPAEEDCVISVEDELGLGSFDPSSSSTLVSDSAGNLRLLDENADTIDYVNKIIAESLPEGRTFDEASKSSRARVKFPTMTLDQVRIESVTPGAIVNTGDSTAQTARGIGIKPPPLKLVLEITIAESKHLEIPLYSEKMSLEDLEELPAATKAEIERSSSILREMSMLYDPNVSANFIVLALALRYKVPTTICTDLLDILVHRFQSGSVQSIPSIVTSEGNCNTAISRFLPEWKSLADLRDQSQRVSQNINQSYEVHKLQGALRIATEKGDSTAIEKIRAALDELDGFEDLPTAKQNVFDGDKDDEGDSDDHNIESGPCSI